jgi:hypothetical protein
MRRQLSAALLIVGLLTVGLLTLGIGIGIGVFSRFVYFKDARMRGAYQPIAAPVVSARRRLVYPLSIVPGGVRSIEELKRAMLNDLVARNFSGFDLSQARFERLRQPECSYVSFRGKRGVAWTRRCIVLPAGELVLTDGRLRFRTKCGNRISTKQQVPTADLDTAQLEIPLPDFLPETAPPLPPTTETPAPETPVETPPVGPPLETWCCAPPIIIPPIVPVGRTPVSVDSGDDWKVEAMGSVLLLMILCYADRTARRRKILVTARQSK